MDSRRRFILQGLVGVLGVFTVGFGWPVNFADNVQRLHGLPFTWGVHQLVTIAGTVDIWTVDVMVLMVDLAIWIALVLLAPIFYDRFNIVSCEICLDDPE